MTYAALFMLTQMILLSDWHEIPVRDTLKDLVTRVSLRVFLGPELCRDPEWLRISRLYQTQSMQALRYLRLFPKILRPVVGRFSSECRQLRHVLAQTRQMTDRVLQERRAAANKRRGGQEMHIQKHNDALTWAEEIAESKGIPSDAATWQLALSTVALHTSSDFIGQAVLDLCDHPDLLQPLREEIHGMMTADGRDAAFCNYSKADIQSLGLMDSVLKESQRLKPVSISKCTMRPSTSAQVVILASNALQFLWGAGSRRK
jgi:cytochrome P450